MVAMVFPSSVEPSAVLEAARVDARLLPNFFAVSRVFLTLVVLFQVISELNTARKHLRAASDLAYPLKTRSIMIILLVALPILLCPEGFPSA